MILVIFPLTATAERGEFDAKIIELTEKGNDEYLLKMVKLSEPYGYEHHEDREIILHLRFKCPIFECTDAETQPTLEEFHQAIELLKSQMQSSETITFGIVDRGFAQIVGTENEYQSNALEIYDGHVSSDYDFFDF